MIRLYVETPLVANQEVSLDDAQSHYLQKVMRLKEGDEVLLFNGVDGEWKARLSGLFKKQALVRLVSQTRPQSKEADLWLLFSPIKPKHQEFLVEKATELGVSCLWPVKCERTSFPKVNLEKMLAHAREASEQCGRLTLPEIKPLTSLPSLLNNWPQERILIYGDETLTSPSLGTLSFPADKPVAFLVGPEGGFTAQEFALLKAHPQAQGVTLNANILRAETAALVGIGCLQLKGF